MIYLYALVDRLDDVTAIRGVADERLKVEHLEGLAIVTGEIDRAPSITRDALGAQDRAIRLLHEQAAALLPMRFGVAYASRELAARALAARADYLREQLQRVRHREQMTLRITGTAQRDSGPSVSGTAYLKMRGTPTEISPILDAVSPYARDSIVERGRVASVLATVYHLIDRGASADYRQAIERIAPHLSALSVHVTGPSPCYAFT